MFVLSLHDNPADTDPLKLRKEVKNPEHTDPLGVTGQVGSEVLYLAPLEET
jgi:hypothetical protein